MSQNELRKLTYHAILVIWGQFGHCLGVPGAFQAVKLHQKTVQHGPQTKVLEFLVSMLAGLEHMQDSSSSDHPLDQDRAVARLGDSQVGQTTAVSVALCQGSPRPRRIR